MTAIEPELRKRLQQEINLGGFRAQAAIDVLNKYSPDQPRDSHGRFGSGGDTGTKSNPLDGTKMSPGEIADHMKAGEHVRINPEQTPGLMKHVDSLTTKTVGADGKASFSNPHDTTKMNYLHYGDQKGTFSNFDEGVYQRGANGKFAGMPQLPDEKAREAFFNDLQSKGVGVTTAEPSPRDLTPMQNEVGLSKTAGINEHQDLPTNGSKPWDDSQRIIVSNDGYVIDGHHRLSSALTDAATNPDAKVGVFKVDMPHDELLASMQKFNEKAGISAVSLGQNVAGSSVTQSKMFKSAKEILPGIPDDGSDRSEEVKRIRAKQAANPKKINWGNEQPFTRPYKKGADE